MNIINKDLKIMFMGTPEIGAMLFEHLISSGFVFSGCITRPDKPKGRGKELAESPVKQAAQKHNISIYQPQNKIELTEIIKETKLDLVIVGAFGMIIPVEAIDIPKYKMINFHPSLLPLYRGPAPIVGPILNSDTETGVSIMLISEGMDEGDILKQEKILLDDTENIYTLSEKLAKLGAEMLKEVVPKWISGELKGIVQNNSLATYTKMVKKEDGKIDFINQTAEQIERMSRAYQPWPGVYSFWNNKKIDFYTLLVSKGSHLSKKSGTLKPGEVEISDSKIYIGTKSGTISPNFIKIEGKNKVTADDFIRGYPNFINYKFK